MNEGSNNLLVISELGSGFEMAARDQLTQRLKLGEHLAISGPSGCGKTSLLLVLAGLKAPASGSLCWQGQAVGIDSLEWWRQQFCYLPQTPVMGADDIAQMLRLPWLLKAMKSEMPNDQRCLSILDKLALPQELNKPVEQLSGGEKQRLAIARAWLMERPVWLLDEPTSALDPVSRNRVIALLSDQPRILVSISHDPIWLENSHYQHIMGGDYG